MPARIEITYVSGSTSTADDNRSQSTGPDGTGTIISSYAFHTITPASAGTVEVDNQLSGAASLHWGITGRGSAGSIHMRFRRSLLGDFSDAVVLFDDLVHYASGVGTVLFFNWSSAPTAYCSSGTRSKAGVPVQQLLTQPLVETILAGVSASPLAPALVSFFGTIYFIEDLCSQLPPPVPPIDSSVWIKGGLFLKQLLDAAAWPYFCECVPASPAPTPPPLPVITVPPGLATIPPVTCDPLELCNSLVALLEQVGQLQFVVNTLYKIVTEQQRFGLPFSYIRGRSIPRVSGSGQVDIERLVGIQAVVDERPDQLQTFTGAPPYIADLGWISCFTPDGMLDEIRLTRDVQVWFSKLLPTATSIGWGLRQGVIVSFTELLAEP